MTLRMCLGGGTATLNQATMDWCKWQGVSEVQIVVPHSEGQYDIPSPNLIHDNGIPTATLNPYNDGWGPGRGAGGGESGFHQAIKSAGWDMIAGEGVDGSVVASIENNIPYCDYHGAGGADGGQIRVYAPPWSHPQSGGKGHCDYVETYVGGGGVPSVQSCIDGINESKGYGSIHYGPLIGMWGTYPCSLGDLINIINQTGSDSVLFWCGYGYDALPMLRATTAGLWDGLKNQFGVTSGSSVSSVSPASPAAPAAPTAPPKNKVLSIAFSDATKGETSRSVKANDIIKITGKSGIKDADGNWTAEANLQQVWGFRVRTDRGDNEYYEDLGTQWPHKDGTFEFFVTWDKRETIKYKVGLVGT